MPISAMKPMLAVNDTLLPVASSARNPPKMPIGTTVSTISVERKLPNSITSTAKMPNSATIAAVPTPLKDSEPDSASPPST